MMQNSWLKKMGSKDFVVTGSAVAHSDARTISTMGDVL